MLSASCSVIWTRKEIHIFNTAEDEWEMATYCERAVAETSFTGRCYNYSMYITQDVSYNTSTTIYSPNYSNRTEMLRRAAESLFAIGAHYDRTQEIQVNVSGGSNSSNLTTLLTVDEDF